MATLYLAHDPNFNREVAIKVLPSQFTHDPQFLARFRREAQAIASLEHPAIVPVYDFGEEENQPFLVMRYMDGGTLRERINAAGGRLSTGECARIFQQIGPGLELAHEEGIIHRDLKPANILFDKKGNAYISDFGIAKLAEATANFTGSAIIGTPAYMSPEQVKGDDAIDGRSDVYALGVLLFEMLTGDQPFKGDTPTKQLMKHVLDPVPDIRQVMPEISPALAAVVTRALAKERDDRFANPTVMAQALAQAAGVTTAAVEPTEVMQTVVADDLTVRQPSRLADPPTPTPLPQVEAADPTPEKKTGGVSLRIIVGIVALLAILLLGGAYGSGLFGDGGEDGSTAAGTPSAEEGEEVAAVQNVEFTETTRETSDPEDTPLPILTDTPSPRSTNTPAAPVSTAAPVATETAQSGLSGSSGGSDSPSSSGSGGGDGGINPFDNPDPELSNFPVPASLPPNAGSFAVPLPGTWTATDFAGQMVCGGRTIPMPAQESGAGTLEVVDGGAKIIVSGIGDAQEVSIELNAEPTITGRYRGFLQMTEDGVPFTLNYIWQLVTDEYIVGFFTSDVTAEGISCTISRPFELVYVGP